MHSSRRNFLKSAAASTSFAVFPRICRAGSNFFAEDALQTKLAADPLRPQFHLLPSRNWMNDPNGPIFWNGHYHMFFQYNPNAAVWGDMHWNHAVSTDMIHWRHLPIALAPTPAWADADGCFTGSAVNDNGVATILYTGVKAVPKEQATLRDGNHNYRETQCLATSRDPQLLTWEKWKEPVIEPPDDPNLTGFRDPFLWRDEKSKLWYLGVASGQFKVGGRILLYGSKDLRNWEYLHPLASGHWREKENTNPVDSGEMWECPDFFPLGKKHVLLYSTAGQVFWEVGDLDPKELVFHSQKRGVLDHGAYYAQKTQLDAKGNRILWGWIPERRSDSELIAAGWAGCMALPRLLSLAPDDALEMRVPAAIQSLHAASFELPSGWQKASSSTQSHNIAQIQIQGVCGEFIWKSGSAPFRLTLEDDTGPWWSVTVEPQETGARIEVGSSIAEVHEGRSNAVRDFRLFLDGSVAELFCEHRNIFTSRIYRKPSGALRVSSNKSDLSKIDSLKAWQLKPISKDRLTT